MRKIEELRINASVQGILPNSLVSVVSVQWFGDEALELTYKDPAGKVANELLYRHDEPRIEVVAQGRPWSFDGDGCLFRLVSEAHRIRLAHFSTRCLPCIRRSSSRCRIRLRRFTSQCCRASHCGFCWLTIQAPGRPSWRACSLKS